MKKHFIYEIWIGEYFYHGQTNNMSRRMSRHKCDLEKGLHANAKMQSVWNKYKTFEYQILLECDSVSINQYEQDYIDANWVDKKYLNLNPKANCPPAQTGNKHMLGKKHSEEVKAILSEKGKGNKHSAGRVHSTEEKAQRNAAIKKTKQANLTKSLICKDTEICQETMMTYRNL